MEISKKFEFEMAHRLMHMPEGHKCARLHGHSYTVELVLASNKLDHTGFVLDYGELDWFKKLIDDKFDHRVLLAIDDPLCDRIKLAEGLVVFHTQPSAEELTKFFFDLASPHLMGLLVAVRVYETRKTAAEYRP